MAFHPIKPEGTTTGRGPSRTLWNLSRAGEVMVDRNAGYFWMDDFIDPADSTDRYTVTQVTAGTFDADSTVDGGVYLADCASTTSGEGVNVQLKKSPFVCAAGEVLTFEARVKVADIATGPQFLIGLADQAAAAITGTTTAVVNTTNVVDTICFTTVKSNDGGNAVYTYKDESGESAVVSTTAIHTLVDDTYVKLGFRVTGVGTSGKIQWFVDGVEKTAFETTAATSNSIPAVGMAPIIVCQSDGTTDPIAHLDWWYVVKSFRKN